jgi:hypothetical protein
LDGYTTEGYTFKQSEDTKKREEEKTPNNQNAHVGVDKMHIIHTLNCCGKALSPKSEIFKFPALSRSKFSGCQSRGKQETYNIRTEMTESKVKLSFACAEGNADYLHTVKAKNKNLLNCTNFKDANRAVCSTHLEISVVHSTTMAIVNSIYKLLKIFPCLILFEPSLVNLANHHKNICC